MPKIFISYRREDSKHAVGRLHAALARHVRNPKRDIFIDIDNIPRGVDFVDHLDGQVAQCDIMLAVIGPGWLTAKDSKTGKRRLDDPQDFVRIEVASALKRGIPVVPVVLDDTKIPVAEDLPDDLRLLARRNGERLEHESFAADVTRLIKNLPTSDARSATKALRVAKPAARGGGWIGPVVALGVVAIAGGGVAVWMLDPFGWKLTARVASDGPSASAPPAASTAGEADGASGGLASPPSAPAASSPPPSGAGASPVPAPSTTATAWSNVDRQDPAALRRFIKDHGASPEAETARLALSKLDSEAWAETVSTNTESSFNAYLAAFPANASPPGAHASDARSRVAASRPAPAASAPAAPIAPYRPANTNFIVIPMSILVDKPVKDVWARIGRYCDIAEWLQIPGGCTISGGKDGEVGATRTVGQEILVGKTDYSYTYTQPVREGRFYNLYHGTLEAKPLDARTTELRYTLMYDNSMVAGDAAAKATDIERRRSAFMAALTNMKTLAEGRALPLPRPTLTSQSANSVYTVIPMSILVDKPVKDVWARIGRYCDIAEWLQIPGGCTISGGKDGEVGATRTVGQEILVGKTDYSYTYTQPVREGRFYNLYHGTLEAKPLDARTTELRYTLMYDNSMVAGDAAAKATDIERRRSAFMAALTNMKTLAEGRALPRN